MEPLYQRLKELDTDTFQRLCFHIIHARHPESSIRHIEGQSGDKGVDLFEGKLEGRPTIWQCKAFPNGVGKSQKSQIKDSLKIVLTHFRPKVWILCLSVDMDVKAALWFERFQKSKKNDVEVGLFSASNIVHELMHNRAVRNHYFPGAGIDITEWKRAASKAGDLTEDELSLVNGINVDAYLERMKERDSRFNYELLFSDNVLPAQHGVGGQRKPLLTFSKNQDSKRLHFFAPNSPSKQSSLLSMSISEGNKTLNLYARDHELLADFTPFDSMLGKTGRQKLSAAIRTGLDQELHPADFDRFELNQSTLKVQFNDIGSDWKLLFSPSALVNGENLKTKVDFESEEHRVEFGLVEFAVTRFGTDELELRSVSSHLPFTLKLEIVRSVTGGTCMIDISEQFAGKQASVVLRYLDILKVFKEKGLIRITSLETENVSLVLPGIQRPYADEGKVNKLRRLLEIVVAASKQWNLSLPLPIGLSEQDFEVAQFLDLLLTGKEIPAELVRIWKLVKTPENSKMMENLPDEMVDVRLLQERWEPRPLLFDIPIDTGPCTILIDKGRVDKHAETISRIKSAQMNEAIDIFLRPQGTMRIVLGNALNKSQ